MKNKTKQQESLARNAAIYTTAGIRKMVNRLIRKYHGTSDDKKCLLACVRAWHDSDYVLTPNCRGIDTDDQNIVKTYLTKRAKAITGKELPSTRPFVVKHGEDPVIEQVVQAALDMSFISTNAEIVKLGIAVSTRRGDLLEEYIWKKARPYGLIWLKAESVKASDFAFEDDGELLQVKNSSNTENSSSSGDRNSYGVPKWWHIDAKGMPRWSVLIAKIQEHTTKCVPQNLFTEAEFTKFCVDSMVANMVADGGIQLLCELDD